MSDSITEYKKWLANQDLDEELRAELTAIETTRKRSKNASPFRLRSAQAVFAALSVPVRTA